MEQLSVERSIWIDAPRERVWEAITDVRQLEAWFSPGQRWEVTALEAGGRMTWHSGEEEADVHVIELVEVPRVLRMRWEPAPPATPLVTTYELEEAEGGTRVTVRETGYELLTAEVREQRMASSGKGYGEVLEGLRRWVEGRG